MTNKYASIIERIGFRHPNSSATTTLDAAHLNKIESQLGYALPKDYKEFLRDYAGFSYQSESALFSYADNGQSEEGGIDRFKDSNDEKTLADNYYRTRNAFMPVDADDEFCPGIHLVRDVPSPVTEMDWPEELLPIGEDGGGNSICLALFGSRPDAIFYCRWGMDIYLVADTFDEFMQLLRPPTA